MTIVSIIMPVFNGETYLAEAIDSVLAQTYTDFELIIVDDGSQDRSAQIIRSYERRDRRIRAVRREENAGQADVRNQAAALARGRLIAAMDCDDICLPERLRKQVDFLEANPAIGLLGTGAQAVSEDLQPLYQFGLPEQHALIAINLFLGSFLIHPTVMIRRELLASVGGYEPSRRTAVDVELWSRLLWRTRFANLSETLLLYRRHEAQHHTTRDAGLQAQAWEVRARLLKRLWGEAPQTALLRFERMRKDQKLSWLERRAASRDLTRLLNAMIAAGVIDEEDRALVAAHIQRRLEATMARSWQIWLHWYRFRIQRHLSSITR